MMEIKDKVSAMLNAAELEAVSMFDRGTIVGAHLENDEVILAAHVCRPWEEYDPEASAEDCVRQLFDRLATQEEISRVLTKKQADFILAMAEESMVMTRASERAKIAPGGAAIMARRIKESTGKDPRVFFDLCELLVAAKDYLKSGEE